MSAEPRNSLQLLSDLTYNGLGQRVEKDNGTVTLFVYDEAGKLIGEYDAAGNRSASTCGSRGRRWR